jgi:hypothetical protein
VTATASGSITPTGGDEGHDLLLTALKTFLTTDSTLVAANESWVVEKEETIATYSMSGVSGTQTYTGQFRDLYLRGPGLSQTDNIYVNLRKYQNSPTSLYNWAISGATTYDGVEDWENQPNNSLVSGHFSYFALTNAQIDYTFVASGRRFIVIVTIGGDTYMMSAGYILPYAIPSEYPYPLAIAGTTNTIATNIASTSCRNFWEPTAVPIRSSLRAPNGVWTAVYGSNPGTTFVTWPWTDADDTEFQLRSNLDDTFSALPAVIYTTLDGGNIYGEWDGVFYSPQFGTVNLVAGDTVTIDAVDYFALQNGQRSNEYEFGLVRLD